MGLIELRLMQSRGEGYLSIVKLGKWLAMLKRTIGDGIGLRCEGGRDGKAREQGFG